MKKEIRDKRFELYKKSKELKEATFLTDDKEKIEELRRKQDELYKREQFYANILKANDKIN